MCDASIPSSCWTSVDLGRLCKLRGTKEFTQLVFLFWLQSIILFLVIAAVLDLSVFSLKFDDHVRADRFVVGFVESEFWLETLKWKYHTQKKYLYWAKDCQLLLTRIGIFISTHKFAFKTFSWSNVSFWSSPPEHFKKTCNSLPFEEEVGLARSSECFSWNFGAL